MRGNLDEMENGLGGGAHPRTACPDSSFSRLMDALFQLRHSRLRQISAENLTDRHWADLMGLREMVHGTLDLGMGPTPDCSEMDWAHIGMDRPNCWNQCAARQLLRHGQNGSVPQPRVRLLEMKSADDAA